MNPYRSGKLVLFQVTYDRDWHFFEIIFFVILGIFGVCSTPTSLYVSDHIFLGPLRSVYGQVQHAVCRLP